MIVLIVLFFFSMVLTMKPAAKIVADAFGIDQGDVLAAAKIVSSLTGGALVLLVSTVFIGIPILAGMLAIAGVIGIGWGIYDLNQRWLKFDAGGTDQVG